MNARASGIAAWVKGSEGHSEIERGWTAVEAQKVSGCECDVEMRERRKWFRRRARCLGVLLTSPLGDCDEVLEGSLDLSPAAGLETAVGVDEEAGPRKRQSGANDASER